MAGVTLDPKTTALMLMDLQNQQLKSGTTPSEPMGSAALIENCLKMLSKAQEVGMPVVYVRAARRPDQKDMPRPPLGSGAHRVGTGGAPLTEGTHSSEIVREFTPRPEDFVVTKRTNGPFNATDLEVYLSRLGITTLLLTGHSTTGVVASCLRNARDKDYDCVVISDCCAAWTLQEQDVSMNIVFPRMAWVATSDEVIRAIR